MRLTAAPEKFGVHCGFHLQHAVHRCSDVGAGQGGNSKLDPWSAIRCICSGPVGEGGGHCASEDFVVLHNLVRAEDFVDAVVRLQHGGLRSLCCHTASAILSPALLGGGADVGGDESGGRAIHGSSHVGSRRGSIGEQQDRGPALLPVRQFQRNTANSVSRVESAHRREVGGFAKHAVNRVCVCLWVTVSADIVQDRVGHAVVARWDIHLQATYVEQFSHSTVTADVAARPADRFDFLHAFATFIVLALAKALPVAGLPLLRTRGLALALERAGVGHREQVGGKGGSWQLTGTGRIGFLPRNAPRGQFSGKSHLARRRRGLLVATTCRVRCLS